MWADFLSAPQLSIFQKKGIRKMKKKTVVVGTVGAGYAAHLHASGYEKVSKINVKLKTVCDLNLSLAQKLKDQYGYENITDNLDEMLNDPEIDVIDIITPPFTHCALAIKAMKAGKHVIVEKPLTGFFGKKGEQNVGLTTRRSTMYEEVMKSMDDLKKVVDETGMKFMYAENHVFATPVQKAAEILRARKSKLLYMRGELSLNGSSSALAGRWNGTGGGILVRNGSHALACMLWFKEQEAKARNEEIKIKSVVADVGVTTACLTEYEKRHLLAHPEDVEDFSTMTITFSDGTKGLVISSDTVLGGTRNYINLYSNDNVLKCNINPADLLNSYFLDEEGMENVEISQWLPAKTGWNQVWVSDEIIRGYTGELQNFMETIAYDAEPESGFSLAYNTAKLLYAAYVSAEEGRRIEFDL